jgi:hypothetical protein
VVSGWDPRGASVFGVYIPLSIALNVMRYLTTTAWPDKAMA